MVDFCNGKDVDYECNEPAPQDPSNRSTTFCNPVGNYYYDPVRLSRKFVLFLINKYHVTNIDTCL